MHNIIADDKTTKVKRQCFSDGVAAQQLKDGSVKKLFIIGLVPDIPENYHNVLTLWNIWRWMTCHFLLR